MTKADIFIKIISEVSGAPKQEVADLLSNIQKAHPDPVWAEKIPDVDIDELITGLREEAPGILAWLIKSKMSVEGSNSTTCH